MKPQSAKAKGRNLQKWFRNILIEKLNIAYSKAEATTGADGSTKSNYWEGKNAQGVYNIINFVGDKRQLGNDSIVDVSQIVDRTFMDEGFMYAFKNCWGLKNAPCKEGIVQDINRISYLGFISHLRRVNTPLSSSAKIRAPHALHGSSWGIMCPSETPDGANIGVRKNLSILSNITFGTNSTFLEKLLFTSNVQDIKQKDPHKHLGTKIFLNEPLAEPLNSPDAVTEVKSNLSKVVLVSPSFTNVLPKVKLEVAKDDVGKPPVLTCKVPPAPIITVLPSTATPNLFPLPPNKAPDWESAEDVISVSVIPCGFTLTPLAPASKVEPETWTDTVAALLPSKVKSVIPLPSVNAFVNFEAVISPLNDPVNEPLNEPVPPVETPLPVAACTYIWINTTFPIFV